MHARLIPVLPVLFVAMLLLAACAGRPGRAPQSAAPGLDVAAAALAAGSPAVALDLANTVLARQPHEVKAMLVQGAALTALGRDQEASAAYRQALAADPASVPAHIGLGRLLLPDDPAQAETLFLEAVHTDPRSAVALNDLGVAEDLRGAHTAAQDSYGRAIAVDPSMHAAEVNLALSMALSGHAEAAVQRLARLAQAPNATRRVRHDYAAALALSGDRAGATAVLAADLPPAEAQQAAAAYGSLAP